MHIWDEHIELATAWLPRCKADPFTGQPLPDRSKTGEVEIELDLGALMAAASTLSAEAERGIAPAPPQATPQAAADGQHDQQRASEVEIELDLDGDLGRDPDGDPDDDPQAEPVAPGLQRLWSDEDDLDEVSWSMELADDESIGDAFTLDIGPEARRAAARPAAAAAADADAANGAATDDDEPWLEPDDDDAASPPGRAVELPTSALEPIS